ncbi:MAG TPA: hypothetical protein VGM26_14130 [Rhizomicrobium sp.]|jgi:hypothetical protein
MARVGFVVLSIVVATAIVVGASWIATWLQPFVWRFAQAGWMLPLVVAILPLAYVLVSRRRRRA